MEPLTEREAILRFLAHYATLAPLERKIRRVETAIIVLWSGAIALNVTLPAVGGFELPDVISYSIACLFALSLRRWILAGIERRRSWEVWQWTAAEAHKRLAVLDELSAGERERQPA